MPLSTTRAAERPSSLRDYAYRELRDAIVSGELAPGERLRDPELEQWLGVSRTPIREAIARLEAAGLVHTRRAKQTVVAPLDARSALAAQRIAAALHELAVRDAVPQLTERRPRRDARRQRPLRRGAATDDDLDAAVAADDDFHDVAVRASANPLLPGMLEQVTPLLRRLERARFGSLAGRGVRRRPRAHHRASARTAAPTRPAPRPARTGRPSVGSLNLDDDDESTPPTRTGTCAQRHPPTPT